MTTTIADIHSTVTAVLAERAQDRRLCYVHVEPAAPAGDRLVLETSDTALTRALAERLTDTAPPLEFVTLPQDGLPERLVTVSSVADIRKEPGHAAELVTQLIDGDAVVPLKQEGDWYLVRLEDGYIGWVRSWHVEATTDRALEIFAGNARHRIGDNVVQIQTEPSDEALPVCDAVVGTPVVAEASPRRGWRQVRLTNGREGYVRSRSVEAIPTGRRISRERLTATGMHFLGIPYLWGGNTPKGFDCSGLIQRVFQLHGLTLPRDSDLQARFGREKASREPEKLETGDLLFFGKSPDQISHVAIYVSNGLFLHAYGQVKVGSIDPLHALYEPKLHRDWHITRDAIKSVTDLISIN